MAALQQEQVPYRIQAGHARSSILPQTEQEGGEGRKKWVLDQVLK
jgi:hypothetical protein